MTNAHVDGQAATGDRYQALLAISEAIISHRDLSSLFHDLAGQLSRVVHFDFLALVLHEARDEHHAAARSGDLRTSSTWYGNRSARGRRSSGFGLANPAAAHHLAHR